MGTAPSTTTSPSSDSIDALLKADHERLRLLWQGVLDAMARSDFRLIQVNAKHFLVGLRAHIDAEERVLYSAIERKLATDGFGPTEDAHEQDRKMLAALDGLKRLETVTELWTATNAIEGAPIDPGSWLRSHASQVEALLCPLADRRFSSSEQSEMVRKLREAGITGELSGIASAAEPARADKTEVQPRVGSVRAKLTD